MTYCNPPCVMLCDLTTCYSCRRAWFQRLQLKHDKPLSNLAFNFNLRRYNLAAKDPINIPGFVTISSVLTLENSLGEVSTRDVSTDTRVLLEVVSGQVRRCRLTLSNQR